MAKKMGVYKCNVCGNIVTVLHEGKGELVCCGEPMQFMEPNTVDASKEKHVPVIEKTSEGYKIKVGSAAHPMEEKHYIEWIHLVAGDTGCRVFLHPGQKPEAEFCIKADKVEAYEYCNIHGHWKAGN